MKNKILKKTQFPFLLTAILAIIAYQLDYMVHSILDTPCITYTYDVISTSYKNGIITEDLQLEVRNLNRKKAFNDLKITLKYSTGLNQKKLRISNPNIIPIAPSGLYGTDFDNRNGVVNSYYISKIHPNNKYLLCLTVSYPEEIDEYPKVYVDTEKQDEYVLLVDGNNFFNTIEIFFVKHQFKINFGFLILWLILIYFYLKKTF